MKIMMQSRLSYYYKHSRHLSASQSQVKDNYNKRDHCFITRNPTGTHIAFLKNIQNSLSENTIIRFDF